MKFLFCSLDSPGFLNPAIGLARALVERGHSIGFVADISCTDRLHLANLRRIPRSPKNDGPSFQVKHWGVPLSIAIQIKHLEHALECFEPDVLVGQQLTLAPLIVAEHRQLPVALMGFCTYLWPTWDPTERFSAIGALKNWRLRDLSQIYNSARALVKMEPIDTNAVQTPLLGDLFFVRSIPELEGNMAYYPRAVRLVGDCLWEPPYEDRDLELWLSETAGSGWPLIYVQHGRFFDASSFWGPLVDALGHLHIRVAASVGRMDSSTGELPPNFYVRPHVPQERVLRQAQGMVASSNTTCVLGALKAGVPSLLIVAGGEQQDVAERCVQAGTARMLQHQEVSADRLRSELSVVLEDRYLKESAMRMRVGFEEFGRRQEAIRLLEALASKDVAICGHNQPLSAGPVSVGSELQ